MVQCAQSGARGLQEALSSSPSSALANLFKTSRPPGIISPPHSLSLHSQMVVFPFCHPLSEVKCLEFSSHPDTSLLYPRLFQVRWSLVLVCPFFSVVVFSLLVDQPTRKARICLSMSDCQFCTTGYPGDVASFPWCPVSRFRRDFPMYWHGPLFCFSCFYSTWVFRFPSSFLISCLFFRHSKFIIPVIDPS